MTTKRPLDRIDVGIIEALQNDGRLSNKELAARVGLAPSSCLERVRRLERDGVLTGYHAEVSPDALGIGLQALVTVELADQSKGAITDFMAHVADQPEIVALYNLAGQTDYALHVMVRDTDHLRTLVLERLAGRPDVARYQTHLVFTQWRKAALPCFAGPEG